ncbi:hypothetical protein CKF54_02305 [Psittacicella hinzii]|uniref:Uncharacterized protein n=1 Tax=Psittacicella hinzii TaxID=2028575 RepID=A0A3A1Y951_9GAMM|nr:hypothetical protein [Psittacicella hinzii]RIY33728.1 hypothetical protein CKF54_02305 [Psittacicella hinzii]
MNFIYKSILPSNLVYTYLLKDYIKQCALYNHLVEGDIFTLTTNNFKPVGYQTPKLLNKFDHANYLAFLLAYSDDIALIDKYFNNQYEMLTNDFTYDLNNPLKPKDEKLYCETVEYYRDIFLDKNFKNLQEFMFFIEDYYIVDKLNPAQYKILDQILNQRINPKTEEEQAFLLINIFRYYLTKYQYFIEDEINANIRYFAIKSTLYQLLENKHYLADFIETVIDYDYYHIFDLNYCGLGSSYDKNSYLASEKERRQAIQITNELFYQKYFFHIYRDLSNPNKYFVYIEDFVRSFNNDLSNLKSFMKHHDLLTFDEEILAQDKEFNNLNAEYKNLAFIQFIDNSKNDVKRLISFFKRKISQLQQFAIVYPIVTYADCANEAGSFTIIPYRSIVMSSNSTSSRQKRNNTYEKEITILSLNWQYLVYKGWGLFTKTLVHEVSHWYDYQLQKVRNLVLDQNDYSLDHDKNFLSLTAQAHNEIGTAKDTEITYMSNLLEFNPVYDPPYFFSEGDDFPLYQIHKNRRVRKHFNLDADFYFFELDRLPEEIEEYEEENIVEFEIPYERLLENHIEVHCSELFLIRNKAVTILSNRLRDIRDDKSYKFKFLQLV